MKSAEINMPDEWKSTAISDAVGWFELRGQRGEYSTIQTRQWKTALRQLQDVMDDTEASDLKQLLDKMGELADRYARKNNCSASTARTYRTKASHLIKDYLAFQASPSTFKPAHTLKKKRKSRAKKAEPEAPKTVAPTMPQGAAELPRQATLLTLPGVPAAAELDEDSDEDLSDEASIPAHFRDYPLSDGRSFHFKLPDGFKVADLMKMVPHLVTLAEDFDPFDERVANLFAISRPRKG